MIISADTPVSSGIIAAVFSSAQDSKILAVIPRVCPYIDSLRDGPFRGLWPPAPPSDARKSPPRPYIGHQIGGPRTASLRPDFRRSGFGPAEFESHGGSSRLTHPGNSFEREIRRDEKNACSEERDRPDAVRSLTREGGWWHHIGHELLLYGWPLRQRGLCADDALRLSEADHHLQRYLLSSRTRFRGEWLFRATLPGSHSSRTT